MFARAGPRQGRWRPCFAFPLGLLSLANQTRVAPASLKQVNYRFESANAHTCHFTSSCHASCCAVPVPVSPGRRVCRARYLPVHSLLHRVTHACAMSLVAWLFLARALAWFLTRFGTRRQFGMLERLRERWMGSCAPHSCYICMASS
jgi:hypothetical protein